MTDHETSGELKRLREENVKLHKVILDALAELCYPANRVSLDKLESILDSAPDTSDEVLALIEANEDEQA